MYHDTWAGDTRIVSYRDPSIDSEKSTSDFYRVMKIIRLIQIHFCKIKISFRRSHDFRLGRRQLLRRRSDDEPGDGLRDFRCRARFDVLDILARRKDCKVLFIQHQVYEVMLYQRNIFKERSLRGFMVTRDPV